MSDNKRIGRPPKGKQPRDKQITIRLSRCEMNLLEECSNKKNIHRTDAIVYGLNLVKKELEDK